MSNILADFSEEISEKMLYESLSNPNLKKEIYLKLLALNALKKVLGNTQVDFSYQDSLFFLPEIFEDTGIFDFYIKNNVFDVIVLAPNSDESIMKHKRNDANNNVSYYLVAELMPDIQSVKLLGYFDAGLYEETYVDNHVIKEKLNIVSSLSKMLEATEFIHFDDISEQFFDLTAKYMDKTLYRHELKEFFDILYNSKEARNIYKDLSRFEFISRCSINQDIYNEPQEEVQEDTINFDEIEQYSDVDLTENYKIPEEPEDADTGENTSANMTEPLLEFEDVLPEEEINQNEVNNDEYSISEYVSSDLNEKDDTNNYEMYETDTEDSYGDNTTQTSVEMLDIYGDLPKGDINPTDGMEEFIKEPENQITESQPQTEETSEQLLNQIHTPTFEDIDNMAKSDSPKEIGMLFNEEEIENLENSQADIKSQKMPGMQLMIDNTKKTKIMPIVIISILIILGIGLLFLAIKPKNGQIEDDFALSEDSAVTDNQLVDAPRNNNEDVQEIPAEDNAPQIQSSVSKDIKSGAAPVILKNVAWEIPESISQDSAFTRYLQIAGKNIKANLEKDLLNTTEFAYNHTIKISMTVKRNSPVKNIKVVTTSGSKEVDEIIIQSIKETLKYINSPVMDNDKGDKDVVLVINI